MSWHPMPTDQALGRGMERQFQLRRDLMAQGATPLGWKVGFGSPAAMARLGTSGPLVGFLTSRSLIRSGEVCATAGWKRPLLEPEIAVHIVADLHGTSTDEEIARAMAALSVAIELADLDPETNDPETILSGNIFHRHVVLGRPVPGASVSDDLSVRVTDAAGNELAAIDDPQATTGKLVDVIRHTAQVLADHGEVLRAGSVVITGSVVPPLTPAPGDHVHVTSPRLGAVDVRIGT
jgi:2-keto-4-pentenoate hydratase